METAIIQWIVQQAGLAGIAALALYMLNKVWEQRVEEINALRQQVLDALNRNTEAMTRLVERLDSLAERMDK